MASFYGEIDLTKIPRELIRAVTFKDGSVHKLLQVDVMERQQPSQYGHTHYISCYNKETREKTYLGDLKPSIPRQAVPAKAQDDDDLPF